MPMISLSTWSAYQIKNVMNFLKHPSLLILMVFEGSHLKKQQGFVM